MSYEQTVELFASARNADAGKPIANNTRLFKRGNDFAVRLHSTDVVTIRPDGTYVLNSGGWLTMTTKDRINGNCPARVYSNKGRWFVDNAAGNPIPFYDGMVVTSDGAMDAEPSAELVAREAETAVLKKLIRKYATDYVKALKSGMPMPSGGDCWGCAFRATDGSDVEPMGTDHLIEHMDEDYFVPSLAVNAMRYRGYRNEGIYWLLGMRTGSETMGGPGECSTVRRAIVSYLDNRLVT